MTNCRINYTPERKNQSIINANFYSTMGERKNWRMCMYVGVYARMCVFTYIRMHVCMLDVFCVCSQPNVQILNLFRNQILKFYRCFATLRGLNN